MASFEAAKYRWIQNLLFQKTKAHFAQLGLDMKSSGCVQEDILSYQASRMSTCVDLVPCFENPTPLWILSPSSSETIQDFPPVHVKQLAL